VRHRIPSERARLAGIVWCVLISQVLLYPGLEELIDALGVETSLQAGMWFLVAEFTAFVLFAGVWGAISDTTGKRRRWIMLGSSGGALAYITLIVVAPYSIPFAAILAIRVLGGAFTIGAFSLGMTMLMDLTGGSGRNMGAAGIAIGLGAALGSVIGGQLTAVNPLGPLYGGVFLLFTVVGIAATLTDRSPTTHLDIRTIVSGARTNSGLLISYSFGFIDRLTAGFFALVGVWYFRDVFGVSAATAGLTLALFFFPFALLQYPFGTLSDRTGRFAPIIGGSLAYGIGIILIGIAPVYTVAAGLMVLIGVCGAFMAPATMALVTDIASSTEHGVAMGGFNIFGSLGFLTGFLVGGVVVSTANYTTAFLVVGGLELLIVTLTFPKVRRLTEKPRTPSN